MLKRTLNLVLLVLVFSINISFSAAADNLSQDNIAAEIFNQLSVDGVNSFIESINKELKYTIPQLSLTTVKQIITGGIGWQEFLTIIMTSLFEEVLGNIHIMGKLLFLAVMCALLQNLQNSMNSSAVSATAYSICFIFLAILALNAFYNALYIARDAITAMVGMMHALLPLLITLLAGVGAITTAALYSPLMLFCISASGTIVKDVILPLLFLTAVIECVNYLGGKYKITYLANFFKQLGMVSLGLLLVLFIGVITIQGAAGSIADGLALRTAKFATATFIPVVGGMFADTVELVMGASLIIKNAVGIFGVIAIFMICVIPLIKLVSLVFIMKATSALVQPMGDEKMAKSLDGMANILLLVFGALLTSALMFFLAITLIVGAGSMALMLR